VSSLFPTPTFWGLRLARCVVGLLSNWVSQLASELHLHLVSPRLACRCPLHCTTPAPGILLLGLQVPTTLCCACTRHSHAQPAGTHRTAPALGITMPSLQVPTVPALDIPMLSLQVPTTPHCLFYSMLHICFTVHLNTAESLQQVSLHKSSVNTTPKLWDSMFARYVVVLLVIGIRSSHWDSGRGQKVLQAFIR
jgi:hypothetical protein